MIVDLLCVGIVVAFFALTWGLMKVCSLLGEQNPGEKL
jgi:hypothetical protein